MLRSTFNILCRRIFIPFSILRIIQKLKNNLELPANDVPFVSRLIVQSLLPGCPLDLVEEGKKLSEKIQPLLKQAKSASTASATSSSSTMDTTAPTGGKEAGEPLVPSEADIMTQLLELCPACGLEVPLEDITSAVCRDGHTWGARSLLPFIIIIDTNRSFSKMLDNDIHPLHALGPHVCGV